METVADVRIGDIRPRIFLRLTMNDRFRQAAPQSGQALEQPLRAEHVDGVRTGARGFALIATFFSTPPASRGY
jgi:hypothetical protein